MVRKNYNPAGRTDAMCAMIEPKSGVRNAKLISIFIVRKLQIQNMTVLRSVFTICLTLYWAFD